MTVRHAFALSAALGALAAWYFLGNEAYTQGGSWIMFALGAACILVLPLEICLFSVTVLLSLIAALYQINELKISSLQMPLTVLDIKLVINDPVFLLDALDIPHWVLIIGGFGAAAIVSAGVILVVFTIFKPRRDGDSKDFGPVITSGVIFVMAAVMLWQFTSSLASNLQAEASRRRDIWKPDGVARLSRDVGVLPFLVASLAFERADPTRAFSPHARSVIAQSFSSTPRNQFRSSSLPNIVVIQAESTFDPNRAFYLTAKVDSKLFSRRSATQSLGTLHVNAVGGGTWITEFEFITGLDSRLFGYSGYYTHISVAPYIRRTFASYLAERGYETYGFYANSGTFYNGRHAYSLYGFKHFFDGEDLGIDTSWKTDDVQFLDSVIQKLSLAPQMPFFALAVTIYNHSPHRCAHFTSERQLVTTFVSNDDFASNCSLNEYLLRLKSTERAFDNVIAYLEALRRTTGRDYVVLIYGDHQPHTFTDRQYYSRFRTAAPAKETFFHIVSSAPGIVPCCGETPAVSVLPSILSGYVARDVDDLYLPINLQLYAICGSDMFPGSHSVGMRLAAQSSDHQCEQAADQAFAVYRQAGIF